MHKNCECPDSTWIKTIYSLPSQYKIRTAAKSSLKVWFSAKNRRVYFFYKFKHTKVKIIFFIAKTQNCSAKHVLKIIVSDYQARSLYLFVRGFSSCVWRIYKVNLLWVGCEMGSQPTIKKTKQKTLVNEPSFGNMQFHLSWQHLFLESRKVLCASSEIISQGLLNFRFIYSVYSPNRLKSFYILVMLSFELKDNPQAGGSVKNGGIWGYLWGPQSLLPQHIHVKLCCWVMIGCPCLIPISHWDDFFVLSEPQFPIQT